MMMTPPPHHHWLLLTRGLLLPHLPAPILLSPPLISLPAHTLSLSFPLCLFACAAEWKYAQMRKGAVKLHIPTGGSSSTAAAAGAAAASNRSLWTREHR